MTLASSADRLDYLTETLDPAALAEAMTDEGWDIAPVVCAFDAPDGYEVSRHGITVSDETLAGAACDWATAARADAAPFWLAAMRAATTLPGSGVRP